jgi:hypothetical protein
LRLGHLAVGAVQSLKRNHGALIGIYADHS